MAQVKETISSQSLLSLNEIREGILILRNGSLRSILKVSGMNLDLKSEEEQNGIIQIWQNLLNNLDFSLEVIIHSRRLNIEPYLNQLKEKINKEPNELLRIQGEDYINFVHEFVNIQRIMKKVFYVVVPYDPIILKSTTIFPQLVVGFKEMLKLSHGMPSTILSNEDFRRYRQQLLIRQDNLISNFSRLGLDAIPLTTKEIIELLFNLYNPETFEKEISEISQETF